MIHEFNIFTNDGWVVTLITDKPIDLGDTIMSSIIVQPKRDHDARVPVGVDPDVTRKEYRLRRVERTMLDCALTAPPRDDYSLGENVTDHGYRRVRA